MRDCARSRRGCGYDVLSVLPLGEGSPDGLRFCRGNFRRNNGDVVCLGGLRDCKCVVYSRSVIDLRCDWYKSAAFFEVDYD